MAIKYKYVILDHLSKNDEPLDGAVEFHSESNYIKDHMCHSWIAEDAAYSLFRHDITGEITEDDWPLKFAIYTHDDKHIGDFCVYHEMIPKFSAMPSANKDEEC